MTSQELFGDIIESEPEPAPATTQRVPVVAVQPPAPAQPKQAVPTPEIQLGIPAAPRPAPAARRQAEPDTAVERALETTLAAGREAGRPKAREETGGASVDELLSQTLSGLQMQVPRKAAAKPSPAAPAPVVEKPPAPVTPAPVEPPKELVAVGFYRYVRNPMYVGILWMLAGHFLWFGYWNLLIYSAVVFLAFYSFVTFYEEPTLKKKFGRAYEEYLQRVPGWIPRLPRTGYRSNKS